MLKRVLSISVLCSLVLIMGFSAANAIWVPDGVAMTPFSDPTAQASQITSDGSGGAIITWQDSRSGNDDISARRVDAKCALRFRSGGQAVRLRTPAEGGWSC